MGMRPVLGRADIAFLCRNACTIAVAGFRGLCSGRSMLFAGVLRRCAPGQQFTPLPAWANTPHIFFCLGKRKRAAPGTKENRSFSGLLVRPVETGLVSSSCAEPLALPVRSRRICFIGYKPEGAKRTRGPSCAAAARPGIRRMFLPAGMQAFFFYPLSGSGAVAQSSPICTNRLLKARQLRRKRHGSARQ